MNRPSHRMSSHSKSFWIAGALLAENLALAVAFATGHAPAAGWAWALGCATIAAAGAFGVYAGLGDRERMHAAFTRLRSEADQLKGWIARIAAGAQDLSEATNHQAGSLQRTASSVEEMSAMVGKSAENAKRSREVATTSLQTANQGKVAVEKMIGAIEEISRSNDSIVAQIRDSNQKITEIVTVISEIGAKTKVINDIVFQTKLLSFNASVEAARAGDHGKGFAVVAEEVGNLAQMSGNAAKEISDLLSGSVQRVEGIVSATQTMVERLVEEGKGRVESGTVVARQCGEVLEAVVRDVGSASGMIGEIALAVDEQAQGIREITQAVNQLDEMTQKNRATSNETAELSTQLRERADSLQSALAQIEYGEYSTPKSGAVVPAPRASAVTSRGPRGGMSGGSGGGASAAPGTRTLKSVRAAAMPARSTAAPASSPAAPAPAAETPKSADKVVSLSAGSRVARRKRQGAGDAEAFRQVSAAGEQVPAEDDPRFQEV